MHHLTPAEAAELKAQPLTYTEVGASLADLPDRYHHLDESFPLDHGRAVFDAAAAGVMAWKVQRGAGLEVRASSAAVAEGEVAVVRLVVGPLGLRAPVRVVRTVDEPMRKGFAYGTLPGHPESGEESFVVQLHDDGSVLLEVRAFSRPATLMSRLGGPVTWMVQAAIARRYGRALRQG